MQSTEQLFIALSNISQNKRHHILTPKTSKHAWHLVVKDPGDWNQVSKIIKQVLEEGKMSTYGPVLKKELCCMNHIVEVSIAPLSDGSFSIADAWVKT